MFISSNFLRFVIIKLHLLVMDNKIIHATYMKANVIVIATKITIIIIYIPKKSHINAISQKEFYIDSILNQGDKHCVEQIHMKLVVFYNLYDILTSHDLYYDQLKMCLLGSK
jgi:hypothetical protein